MPARRTAEEAGILGDEIYEWDIKRQVEDAYHGKIVAIDVNSGDYAIGDTVSAASKRLRTRMSGASESDTVHYATSGGGPCGAPND